MDTNIYPWWPFGRDPNTIPVEDIENLKPAYLRRNTTLGLGDILRARHLYPCDCPLPTVVDP